MNRFVCKSECKVSVVFESGLEIEGTLKDLSMVAGFIYCNQACFDGIDVFVRLCINGHIFFSRGRVIDRTRSGFLVCLKNWESIRNELVRCNRSDPGRFASLS